jgi:competence protein ComEC
MPSAVFGVLASLFGLDAPVWWIMGQGVGVMLDVASWVADLPGAVRMVPSFGAGALLTMTLGLLWLTLWQSSLRWAGLVFAVVGVGLALTARQPDLTVDARGQALAFRGVDGRLHALNPRGDYFALSQWLAGDADPRHPRKLEAPKGAACDASGCIGRMDGGRIVALVLERRAFPEDCARAFVVVTRLPARGACVGPRLVLDAAHFAAAGATRVSFDEAGQARVSTARSAGKDRPWSPAPRAAPPQAAEEFAPDEEPTEGPLHGERLD